MPCTADKKKNEDGAKRDGKKKDRDDSKREKTSQLQDRTREAGVVIHALRRWHTHIHPSTHPSIWICTQEDVLYIYIDNMIVVKSLLPSILTLYVLSFRPL